MDKNDSETSVQLNLAREQRNSARDYFELQSMGNMPIVLATWNTDKLEMQTKNSPHMFKHRYGFDAKSLVRTKVVDFQKQFELTDSEIRWLRRSTAMRIKQDDINIDGGTLSSILGWVQVALFTTLFIAMIMRVDQSSADGLKKTLGFGIVSLLWTGLTLILVQMYIAPRCVLKRSGVLDWKKRQRAKPQENEPEAQ